MPGRIDEIDLQTFQRVVHHPPRQILAGLLPHDDLDPQVDRMNPRTIGGFLREHDFGVSLGALEEAVKVPYGNGSEKVEDEVCLRAGNVDADVGAAIKVGAVEC